MKISTGMMNVPLIILISLMIAFSAYVKSWSLLYTLLAASVSLTVMISLPFIVSPLQHSKFLALRILRLLVITLWTIGLVGVLFSVVERLVWVNATAIRHGWRRNWILLPSRMVKILLKQQSLLRRSAGKIKVISALSPDITVYLCAAMIACLSTPGGRVSTGLKPLRLDDAFL